MGYPRALDIENNAAGDCLPQPSGYKITFVHKNLLWGLAGLDACGEMKPCEVTFRLDEQTHSRADRSRLFDWTHGGRNI